MAYALASLFKVSVKETQPISDAVLDGWQEELHKFCATKKTTWLVIHKAFSGLLKNSLYLAIGTSPRNKNNRHCVVMKGDKMIFDPHPSNKGIKSIDEIWVFIPYDVSSYK